MTRTLYVRIRAGALLLAALLACILLTSSAFAGVPKPQAVTVSATTVSILPPSTVPYGKTYDEWSRLWFQWFLPLTVEEFNNCKMQAVDPNVTFIFAGPPICTGRIPSGTSLFFPIVNVDCSNLEAPPFFGATPSERADCAAGFLSFFREVGFSVEINGTAVENLLSYLAVTGDFPFSVGPDNVFGIPCGANLGTPREERAPQCHGLAGGVGYYLMLAPPPSGTHTIRIRAGDFIDTTWTLVVGR